MAEEKLGNTFEEYMDLVDKCARLLVAMRRNGEDVQASPEGHVYIITYAVALFEGVDNAYALEFVRHSWQTIEQVSLALDVGDDVGKL